MTLAEYRKIKGLSLGVMARLIGVRSRASIQRYERGRIPRRAILARIVEATAGEVTAADFYPSASSGQAPASAAVGPLNSEVQP